MAWGVFKKLKKAINKVGNAIGGGIKKIFNTGKKALTSDTFKGIMNTGVKLAPVIGGAIGSAYGNPQAGLTAGNTFQNIGNSLGYG